MFKYGAALLFHSVKPASPLAYIPTPSLRPSLKISPVSYFNLKCKEDISCEIIKPTYRIEELSGSNYTKKLSRKKKTIQATYREKIIIGIISILVILFILKPKYETEEVNHSNAMKNMIVVTKPNHELEKKIVEKNKIEKRRKVVEKKVIAANSRYSENRKVLKVQDEKSKREEAKAILMMQMQN